jgi:ribose 1,5-bisphosphokinase PhnN
MIQLVGPGGAGKTYLALPARKVVTMQPVEAVVTELVGALDAITSGRRSR